MVTSSEVKELLEGAVDMHVHSAPDTLPRKHHDIEIARQAAQAGFAAVVLKNHFVETASRAFLAGTVCPSIRVYGGVCLNRSMGGLNPWAVETALKLGARIVWMPTVDSARHRVRTGKKGGIRVVDADGRLPQEVQEILTLVKEHDAVLATGHLSKEEVFTLVPAAKKAGVEKIVITHPEFWITPLSPADQLQLAAYGVFFERCYYSATLPHPHRTPFETSIQWIRKLGHRNTILSSDLGQTGNPSPVEGFSIMVQLLLKEGCTPSEIESMIQKNPRALLEHRIVFSQRDQGEENRLQAGNSRILRKQERVLTGPERAIYLFKM